MNKKSSLWIVMIILILIIFIGVIVATVAIYFAKSKVNQFKQQQMNNQNFQATPTPTPTEKVKNTEQKSDLGNVVVYTPTNGEKLLSPYIITGKARVFENMLNYELKDDQGRLITQGTIYANSPDAGQFGEFSTTMNYITSAATGSLEVFDTSPKDGSQVDLVKIEVKF